MGTPNEPDLTSRAIREEHLVAVHRVLLDQPTESGFQHYDFIGSYDADEAWKWTKNDFPNRNVTDITELENPDGSYHVNGIRISPPIGYPYDGPPQPAVALNDDLDPLDAEDLELCADLTLAIGPELMFAQQAFTAGDHEAITARLESQRQQRAHDKAARIRRMRATGEPA